MKTTLYGNEACSSNQVHDQCVPFRSLVVIAQHHISWYKHTAENEAKSYSFAQADNDITCINLHPESTHCTDKGSDKPGYSQKGKADEEEDMSWLLSQEPSL